MKFVALVSGGKDSIYAIVRARALGHELIACVHLARPNVEEEESFLYQTAASEAVRMQVEECMNVPLISIPRTGTSRNTSLVYEDEDPNDEVEDLYRALRTAKEQFPQMQAVSSGAILSTYQRIRIEQVCGRLGVQPLAYLWRSVQQELLDEMIQYGLNAVLVKTAAPPGLQPHKHLNKSLIQLTPHLRKLNERYQFHVCGEGGEYESLVLDCPGLFRKHLVLDEVEIVTEEDDDEIGVLLVKACHAEEKPTDDLHEPNLDYKKESAMVTEISGKSAAVVESAARIKMSPHVQTASGGLWSMSEVWCHKRVDTVAEEAKEIFRTLQLALNDKMCTTRDVLFVHLYLQHIEDFALVNSQYRDFFGVILPPSRSTVAVSHLPNSRKIMMDCMVQCGSGDYLRSKSTSSNPYTTAALAVTHSHLRRVLHVQSISHWAPVCVGPYSQANTLRDSVHFVAGQIGLVPDSMTLRPTWHGQLQQAWTNLANVLDGIDGSELHDMISCVVYASHDLPFERVRDAVKASLSAVQQNGGVKPGLVDGTMTIEDTYEDEGTRLELETQVTQVSVAFCPCLIVSIPQMPVGALVEIEASVASQKASSKLKIANAPISVSHVDTSHEENQCSSPFFWDTGRDFSCRLPRPKQINITSVTRSVGHRKSVASTVLVVSAVRTDTINIRSTAIQMVQELVEISSQWLHLRAYYLDDFDNVFIREALSAAVMTWLPKAALSSIPVRDLGLIVDDESQDSLPSNVLHFLAIQGLAIDPLGIEDDIWINNR